MTKGALSDSEWRWVQANMPIACVDVLPFRHAPRLEIGLIRRETPHQGQRWCLIGGRMGRSESLVDAAIREVRETLGPDVSLVTLPIGPLYVAEYFPKPRAGGLHDPRQHALGITFAAEINGAPRAEGEALAFRWFEADALPSSEAFGFGQERVVAEVIARLSAGTLSAATR